MSNKKTRIKSSGHSALKGIAIFLAIVIMLGIIGGAVWIGLESNWYRDWSKFTGRGPNAEEEFAPPKDVTDGDGNELTSDTVYDLPHAMIYARTTEQSETASEGVTVEAKVLPDAASDKTITWTYGYADPSSEWAQANAVETVLSVTPEYDGSSKVQIKCLKEFAEQIILTATSRANPEKSDSCTVDFVQHLKSVSISVGNVSVNLGGNTNVNVDLGTSSGNSGGAVTLEYTLSEIYSLADPLTESLSFEIDANENLDENSKYVYHTERENLSNVEVTYNIPSGKGSEIYFDLRLFEQYNFKTVFYTSINPENKIENIWANKGPNYIENLYKNGHSEDSYGYRYPNKVFWTIALELKGNYNSYQTKSDICWLGIESSVYDVSIIDPEDKVVIF